MSGQLIEFAGNGKSYQGYLAPSHSGSGPGIIVIQEWWGLVGHITDVADRFAAAGFTALAPDFYHGEKTTEPDEAGSLMMALDVPDAEKVIRGAISTLLAHDSVAGDSVGVVGFCMGGKLAMYAACLDNRIGACVNFYGIHPNVVPDYSQLSCEIMGNFAEHDDYASPESVAALSSELSALEKPHTFKTYAGSHHAFFNSDRPEVYDESAAEDCWARMVEFFSEKLS